jgi:tRNA pseudouridine38-40 synthase
VRAYRLAYDGTAYRGYQRQPHGETVEDELFRALASLSVTEGGPPERYAAAGRTDRGVSALGQTIAFEGPAWLTPRALNGGLPASVRAWAAADVSDEFHARYDALSRTYTYHRLAPAADPAHAQRAADRLSGQHDFHNLTPDEDGTTRTLSVDVERDGDFLVFHLEAPGFARQLVRRVVSLVGAVAHGERDLGFVDRVLSSTPLDGPDGVAPAPPEGLVFRSVAYEDVSFTVDEAAAKSAREVFETRHRSARTRARVTGLVADAVWRP